MSHLLSMNTGHIGTYIFKERVMGQFVFLQQLHTGQANIFEIFILKESFNEMLYNQILVMYEMGILFGPPRMI